MKLEGQAAIVTGGGQGIGRAVVERLAAEGARVAVLDMNPDNAKEVVDGLNTPSNHLALQTNVADSASVITNPNPSNSVGNNKTSCNLICSSILLCGSDSYQLNLSKALFSFLHSHVFFLPIIVRLTASPS